MTLRVIFFLILSLVGALIATTTWIAFPALIPLSLFGAYGFLAPVILPVFAAVISGLSGLLLYTSFKLAKILDDYAHAHPAYKNWRWKIALLLAVVTAIATACAVFLFPTALPFMLSFLFINVASVSIIQACALAISVMWTFTLLFYGAYEVYSRLVFSPTFNKHPDPDAPAQNFSFDPTDSPTDEPINRTPDCLGYSPVFSRKQSPEHATPPSEGNAITTSSSPC